MQNLNVIDTPLIFSSIIAGFIAGIILLYPLISYGKEFGKIAQTGKTYIEIISKTLLIQLAIALFFVALTTFWNIAVGQNDRNKSYSLKYGTAMFFGHFNLDTGAFSAPNYQNNEGFWTMWDKLAASKAKDVLGQTNDGTLSAGTRKIIGGGIILISMANIIIWVILLIMPLFFTFAPIVMMTRKQGQDPEGRTALEKTFWYLALTILLVLISFMHLLIADAYVNYHIGADFSYYKNMLSIWGGLIK